MTKQSWFKTFGVLLALTLVISVVACSSSGGGVIELKASGLAFDKSTIRVSAGAQVTINFTNSDQIQHNFALYTDSTASTPIFIGGFIGPGKTTYTFTAPSTPGTYFFRCNTHPTTMTGSFVVS